MDQDIADQGRQQAKLSRAASQRVDAHWHGRAGQAPRGALLAAPFALAAAALARPRRCARCSARAGSDGMAAFFLAPNMVIFGVFVLFPLVINFAYSMTGGTALFLRRPHLRRRRALRAPARLRRTTSTPRPARGQFWTAVRNTAGLRRPPGGADDVAAMVTALILNREIRGRGFWRACSSSRCCCRRSSSA